MKKRSHMKKIKSVLIAGLLACSMTALPMETAAADSDCCVDVSVGNFAMISVMKNGDLYWWGNAYEDGIICPSPQKIRFDKKAVAVEENYVMTEDRDVYRFDFTHATPSYEKIMSGASKLCYRSAITQNGDLYVFDPVYDGNGNTLSYGYTGAVKVKGLEHVVSAYSDPWFSCAVTNDGSLYTWGSNMYGQSYGNGHLGYISDHPEYETYSQIELYPKKVELEERVIDAKFNGTFGDLYILTENHDLCICDYDSSSVDFPSLFNEVYDFEAGSSFHGGSTLFLFNEDRVMYAFGDAPWGYFGGKEPGSQEVIFTEMPLIGNIYRAAASGNNFAVITEEGTLYTWGENDTGIVGNGEIAAYDNTGELGEINAEDVIAPCVIFEGDPDGVVLQGDVDSDRIITTSDAANILVDIAQVGAGYITGLTGLQAYYGADVNYDHTVDTADAALILQYVAEMGSGNTDVTFADLIQ